MGNDNSVNNDQSRASFIALPPTAIDVTWGSGGNFRGRNFAEVRPNNQMCVDGVKKVLQSRNESESIKITCPPLPPALDFPAYEVAQNRLAFPPKRDSAVAKLVAVQFIPPSSKKRENWLSNPPAETASLKTR